MNKISKVTRIFRQYKILVEEFNFKVMIYSVLTSKFYKYKYLGKMLTTKKEKVIKEYLYECTKTIQKKYEKKKFRNERISDDSPIWFFWWQGLEDMPEIIIVCYRSIIKHSKKHKVIFIDKNNYYKYVHLPEYIVTKYLNGEINHPNFSDILRMALLSKYGGIWLDATIYMHKPFNEDIYLNSFCSNKRKKQQTSLLYPAKCRWAAYFLACGKDNILPNYVKDVFFEYWKTQNISIDYYIVDFIISLGYDTNKEIKCQIDNSPYSNEHSHQLLPKINEQYDKTVFDEFNNTNIYKLSYKQRYIKEVSGKKTIYGYLTDQYL